MARVDIRDIDESVVLKLNKMAADKKISREELCRKILKDATLERELKSQENKYAALIESLTDILKQNTDAMERMGYMMELLMEKI